MKCPKCGHERPSDSSAPAWQCPACGIAYAKYEAYLTRRQALKPRPEQTDVARSWPRDLSLWTLIAANLFTLVAALEGTWALHAILLVYWAQSVAIGLTNAVRLVALRDFSTRGFKINNRRPPETARTKWSTALFFSMHYGFFHLIYLVFILADAEEAGAANPLSLGFVLAVIGFVINHAFSLRYNIETDHSGKPNIGTLMMLPYARILPMHLTIIFGMGMMRGGQDAVMLFIGLKTLADAVMHFADHVYLARLNSDADSATSGDQAPR